MNKSLPVFFFLLFFVQLSNAQFLWYENESNTYKIEQESTSSGTFLRDVPNPNTTGINTNTTVSKFNREEGTNAFLQFDLYNAVTDFSGYAVTFKAYIDIPTAALTANNSKISVHLSHATVSSESAIELNFTVGQQWETFTFNFNGTSIPNAIINANGYQHIALRFANGTASVPATTYYIDSISGTTDQVVDVPSLPASWLSGSWGITFPVYGGERLDSEVTGGYNYSAGAQEIVDELPATGHVITNLTNFAKSYYFTLRDNPNVDIATEIDELLVPSLENEAVIFDVLQKFQDAGKKNILYISTNYFDRLGPDESNNTDFNTAHAAWVTYYTNNFAGNEYLAYRDLIQGFILRVKDYADGYWLDTTSELYNDGHLEDFVQMIKNADPTAIIGAQPTGLYFTDENGNNLLVDSDGIDDEDDSDYRIIKFEANSTYQDYTKGHVTPLGQGAPPNSWAYEEYTIPNMVENPWSMYEGNTVLKHAWFPIREKWHVSSHPIVFGIEDAYRFTKRLVQANAALTFATTIDDTGSDKGYMMDDEMLIMKAINDRLLSIPIAECEPYVRPEGAHLVGEAPLSVLNYNPSEVKLYPNPVSETLILNRMTSEVNYITVFNTIGTKVLEKVWHNGSTTTQLDMRSLDSGIYFVKLSNSNHYSITRKIIVSK
ncbi:T9SS type A sorting domain-containing protein [Winogradskyella sp. ECml5-4]|uniref:T9SS type A sorting domain-containing protein n=1 Tax=Winogradskyella sp. ECml5-4 TaxID=3110975 RepID=UPI002FF24654